MTKKFKEILVDTHNEKRNLVAGGKEYKHKAACRVATMQWDDELAKLATLYVILLMT